MRRIVAACLMIVLVTIGFTQEVESWKSLVKSKITKHDPKRISDIYLIEANSLVLRKTKGVRILRSIDSNHHIIKSDQILSDNAWEVNDFWKLDLVENNQNIFRVLVTEQFDPALLSEFELVEEYSDRNTYTINASKSLIEERLLTNPEVIHITNRNPIPKVEVRVIDLNLNPNRVNKIHRFDPQLDGEESVVSIQENDFDSNDIDLLNRRVKSGLESQFTDNHATEMATIIGGTGSSFITGRGVASSVAMTSSSFDDVMPDNDQIYIDLGVNIQNHSYGVERDTLFYDLTAMAFDQSAYNNRNLLHIISSGNEGLSTSAKGTYKGIDGFANLTGNFKMSKNTLAVGSVDTLGNVPAFVSRGPAYDGRVKPELVAYGLVGSSNSAALVSGISILLHEQFENDHARAMPSALLKSLLITSASDVGPVGLDHSSGYGSVNAWRALDLLKNDQYDSGQIGDGMVDQFSITIPIDAINLKVTLVWTDPAANVGDFQALKNDLDLRLNDGGMTTLPWVLNTGASANELSNVAIRAVDNLNNVEQVTIENPETNYIIEVEASEVVGNQSYYISWQYDLKDTFEWDFPLATDNMPYNGETGSYFRWTSTREGVGELAYTTDETNWIVLDPAIDIGLGYWRWHNPPVIEDEVRARMTIDGEIFETELFTVSTPFEATTGFNCGDSLMIKWDGSPNAVNYTIYNMGERFLEELTTTEDTFLIIQNNSFLGDNRFSIQPNLAGGKELLSAPTFDYAVQGPDCYVFSFFQTIALDSGIYLNLRLGTTYGINEIILERNDFTEFVEIANFNPQDEEIIVLDQSPNQGFNEHRAILKFQNGEEVILSTGSLFYLTEIPIKVFPNPIQLGESLTVITREFDDTSPVIELMDSRGAVVYRDFVFGGQNEIPTTGLQSGIYFYRFIADDKSFTGRVILR